MKCFLSRFNAGEKIQFPVVVKRLLPMVIILMLIGIVVFIQNAIEGAETFRRSLP